MRGRVNMIDRAVCLNFWPLFWIYEIVFYHEVTSLYFCWTIFSCILQTVTIAFFEWRFSFGVCFGAPSTSSQCAAVWQLSYNNHFSLYVTVPGRERLFPFHSPCPAQQVYTKLSYQSFSPFQVVLIIEEWNAQFVSNVQMHVRIQIPVTARLCR